MNREPFVSIVTPVFNGEPYIAQAIESVLAQPHSNWEYIIVNNCSTDRTLAVCETYAAQDGRIRIVTNDVFVNCEENHNNAFRQISSRSEYCKVVSADDWLLPDALPKLVRLAKDHPSVGIVGSYQRSNDRIRWKGLPQHISVLPGREASRLGLLHGVHVFGNPMSVLYRSDLIRRKESFFPHDRPHADTSACYAHLHDCDFGFVHEVLSVERIHEGQVTSRIQSLNAGDVANLEILLQYGRLYLTEIEFAQRCQEVMTCYYEMLGRSALKFKGRDFWEFHRSSLHSLGHNLNRSRVAFEAIRKVTFELADPVTALRKLKGNFVKFDRP